MRTSAVLFALLSFFTFALAVPVSDADWVNQHHEHVKRNDLATDTKNLLSSATGEYYPYPSGKRSTWKRSEKRDLGSITVEANYPTTSVYYPPRKIRRSPKPKPTIAAAAPVEVREAEVLTA